MRTDTEGKGELYLGEIREGGGMRRVSREVCWGDTKGNWILGATDSTGKAGDLRKDGANI